VKLSEVQPVDAWNYINGRKKQKSKRGGGLVTARTVSRERAILQDCFQIAKTQWGYSALENVFRGLKIKGAKFKRTRRLEEARGFAGESAMNEYDRIMEACRACRTKENKLYLPIAINMAIETGMRSQELFNLVWRDIDFAWRTIRIGKSKTDHVQETPGRVIVLPWMTMARLVYLLLDKDGKRRKVRGEDRVFPMTQEALEQAFDRAKERAGVTDLQWKDFRREANTRWGESEPPLTDTQRKAMMGHLGSSVDINDVYSAPNLRAIREKLDRQFRGGTFEEQFAKKIKSGMSNFDIVAEQFNWIRDERNPWSGMPDYLHKAFKKVEEAPGSAFDPREVQPWEDGEEGQDEAGGVIE
jgi:integrase